MSQSLLKGTTTLMIWYIYKKESYKPWILIQDRLKKWGSCGHLNVCKWAVMEAAIFCILYSVYEILPS